MTWGKIFWLVVGLLCVAAIALMVFRPARVVGPNEKSLAYSVKSAADASESGECAEVEDDWLCRLKTFDKGSSSKVSSLYAVEVDDWGCWNAYRRGLRGHDNALPRTLDGCITIADLIRVGD